MRSWLNRVTTGLWQVWAGFYLPGIGHTRPPGSQIKDKRACKLLGFATSTWSSRDLPCSAKGPRDTFVRSLPNSSRVPGTTHIPCNTPSALSLHIVETTLGMQRARFWLWQRFGQTTKRGGKRMPQAPTQYLACDMHLTTQTTLYAVWNSKLWHRTFFSGAECHAARYNTMPYAHHVKLHQTKPLEYAWYHV